MTPILLAMAQPTSCTVRVLHFHTGAGAWQWTKEQQPGWRERKRGAANLRVYADVLGAYHLSMNLTRIVNMFVIEDKPPVNSGPGDVPPQPALSLLISRLPSHTRRLCRDCMPRRSSAITSRSYLPHLPRLKEAHHVAETASSERREGYSGPYQASLVWEMGVYALHRALRPEASHAAGEGWDLLCPRVASKA